MFVEKRPAQRQQLVCKALWEGEITCFLLVVVVVVVVVVVRL
jgi:hypothetical protein